MDVTPVLIDLPLCCRFATVKRNAEGELYACCEECGSVGKPARDVVTAYHYFCRERTVDESERKPKRRKRFG